MINTQGQGINVEDLSREDLVRIVMRDQTIKRELSGRVGALTAENVELYVVINELQQSLSAAQPNNTPEQPSEQMQFPTE